MGLTLCLKTPLNGCRQQLAGLQADNESMQAQLAAARHQQAARAEHAAGLETDKAFLQKQLSESSRVAQAANNELNSYREALAQERAAAHTAAGARMHEQRGLQQRVQELEALCGQQEQQLGELPMLQQQVRELQQLLEQQRREKEQAEQVGAGGPLRWPACCQPREPLASCNANRRFSARLRAACKPHHI